MKLELDRFLNLTYFFATENSDEQERSKFDTQLNLPDARARERGNLVGTQWDPENEQAALTGLAAALTGRST